MSDQVMQVPRTLKALFDQRGYVVLREFASATGITYPNVLRRVQTGDIPAVDMSPATSKRSQWRIYEEQAAEWFAARCSRPPVPDRTVVPDFYTDSGEWIPPEERVQEKTAVSPPADDRMDDPATGESEQEVSR